MNQLNESRFERIQAHIDRLHSQRTDLVYQSRSLHGEALQQSYQGIRALTEQIRALDLRISQLMHSKVEEGQQGI